MNADTQQTQPVDMAKPKALFVLVDTFVKELSEHYNRAEIFSALAAYSLAMVKDGERTALVTLIKSIVDNYETNRRSRKG